MITSYLCYPTHHGYHCCHCHNYHHAHFILLVLSIVNNYHGHSYCLCHHHLLVLIVAPKHTLFRSPFFSQPYGSKTWKVFVNFLLVGLYIYIYIYFINFSLGHCTLSMWTIAIWCVASFCFSLFLFLVFSVGLTITLF
mgnify:CR=1 FL=1